MLAVSSPQPQQAAPVPPMDNPPMPPQEEMPMDDEMADENGQDMPPMDNGGEQGNPYDTNFDAGVDADEDEDPKRYIQQLTGKLSQSLRNYNDSLPKPDEDLCKYVANMINKQASQGLSPDDTNEILKKLTSDDKDDTNEGVEHSRHHNIDEIFNDIMNGEDEEDFYNPPLGKTSFRQKPFTAPKFK